MNTTELTFQNLQPEWIDGEQSVRFTGVAGGAPVTFFFSAEALCWLSRRDHMDVEAALALEMFSTLEDTVLRIAQEEWESARGESRTFRIGWLKTDCSA